MSVPDPSSVPEQTDVLVVGGGPAGALLSCMLARRGIDVTLVEKQATIERTFRGDTITGPSLLMLDKLGFGEAIRRHGTQPVERMVMFMEGRRVMTLEYGRLRNGTVPVDMPQPALLEIINRAAAEEPGFRFFTGTALSELVEENGRVVGAVLRRGEERITVRTRLVVGADGRFSKVRNAARIAANITPMERDVLWFRLPRPGGWPPQTEFFVNRDRHVVVMPTFPDALRVATNLPKKALGEWRKAGLETMKRNIRELDPRLGPLMDEGLHSWDDTSFLEIFTAQVDEWTRDGLLLIGDASHTVTPILGQGINLAMQDCIEVTPLLARALSGSRGVVPAATFAEFVARRRRHKDNVVRYQARNESGLVARTPLQTLRRRLRYQILDHIPGRYRFAPAILSDAYPIDPDDLRSAGNQQKVPA
ncbi:FAD-dependent monooxygenase [Dactylosporangium sp. NPDC005572]|uniref:FAD-dependent monooxygenase n=1 Tax=Dactylosporangium sp. NPDC005572 TaxID=3156889 RepID=UPI0033A2CA09